MIFARYGNISYKIESVTETDEQSHKTIYTCSLKRIVSRILHV